MPIGVVVLLLLALILIIGPRRYGGDAVSLIGVIVAVLLVLWAVGILRTR